LLIDFVDAIWYNKLLAESRMPMSELREKYELLVAEDTSINPPKAKDTTEFLYAALTILDSKASALMTFDSILIAAAAFTIEKDSGFDWQRVFTLLAIVIALVAAALCLLVARISYRFLGKVAMTPAAAETPARLDYSNELSALDEAVIKRTGYYRTAWGLSLMALVPFIVMFVLKTLS
jgi:hypothetical protein